VVNDAVCFGIFYSKFEKGNLSMAEVDPQAVMHRRFPNWVNICVVGLFILGTGLRLLDLTNPPRDYFPQR
jgi:hypothetical protein